LFSSLLKLPEYDPSQFGASGDTPYFAAIRAYLAEHDAAETVGGPAYALVDGEGHEHRHDHDPAGGGGPDAGLHRHTNGHGEVA
jgi:hypothetical protein